MAEIKVDKDKAELIDKALFGLVSSACDDNFLQATLIDR